jgi:hypothetical protein
LESSFDRSVSWQLEVAILVCVFMISGNQGKLVSQEFKEAQHYNQIINSQSSGPYARRLSLVYDNSLLYSTSNFGPLRSQNGGRIWSTLMSPEEAVFFVSKLGFAATSSTTFLYSGQALQATVHTSISTDEGKSWNQTWPVLISGLDVCTFTQTPYHRVSDHYTSDGGLTWVDIPQPDSVSTTSRLRFDYIGDGRFYCRHSQSKRWYAVNVESKMFELADIPFEVQQIFLLPTGGVLGYESSGMVSAMHYRLKDEEEFQPLPVREADGLPIDSFYVQSIEELDGGAVAARLSRSLLSQPDLMAVFTGDSVMTFRVTDLDPAASRWGAIQCSSGFKFLISLINDKGRDVGLALVDATKSSMRVVKPAGTGDALVGWRFDADVMNDSIATGMNNDGSVHLMNINSGEVTIGGSVDDPYGRFTPIRYDALLSAGNTLHSVDEQGTVSAIRDDSVSVLKGWRTAMRLLIPDAEQNRNFTLTKILSLGTGHVWARDATILSGGPHLWELRDTTAHSILRTDTTTFWTRLNNSTELAGYREVTRRLKGADQFDTIATISDGRAVIGAMQQVSHDIILAALRGYVHTLFEGGSESEADTISGGLWRSTDGGLQWERIALPADGEMILSLQQRPSDGSVWISMRPVHRESIIETDANGKKTIVQELLTMGEISLLRSTDKGTSWDVVHSQNYNGSYQPSTSNVAFQGANTVVWATHDRVLWSDDNGSTWRLVDGIAGLRTVVGSVAFDATGALWAATSEGLFKADPINVSVDETESESDDINEPTSRSTPIFWANTFPNPTDRTFTLRLYNLDRLKGPVDQLEIVDLLGRSVLDLRPHTYGARPTGTVDIPLDLGTDAAGLYLLVGRTSDRAFTWPMWVY